MSDRGKGFVHLNTPASIDYTRGQKVSRTDLRQHRARVDCVILPAYIAAWREGITHYTSSEGYTKFANDREDEQYGSGIVRPPLAAAPAAASNTSFLVGAGVGAKEASSSTSAGIQIVSHHKVSGAGRFIYPDHDGVLANGVVPEVVVTAEEKEQEAATRHFFISPIAMSPEELEAFEELQRLWKNRARSHSIVGSQLRQAAGGSKGVPVPGEDLLAPPTRRPRKDGHAETTHDDDELLQEEECGEDFTDHGLEEALRMADDLLRFA